MQRAGRPFRPGHGAPTPPPATTAAQPTAAHSTSAAGGFDEKAIADFYRGKTVRVVIGFGAGGERVPDTPLVKGAPRALDLTQTDDQKALLRALATQDAFVPPYAMAPEVPQDRVLALRQALAQTLADPATRADADKANLLLDPRAGDEIAVPSSRC